MGEIHVPCGSCGEYMPKGTAYCPDCGEPRGLDLDDEE